MTRLIHVITTLFLFLSFLSVTATADVQKGKKLYIKKLKPICKISGSDFAAKHSQDEWEEIYDAGEFNKEIKNICGATIEEKFLPHIYDFAYEYANDSGNVPSC